MDLVSPGVLEWTPWKPTDDHILFYCLLDNLTPNFQPQKISEVLLDRFIPTATAAPPGCIWVVASFLLFNPSHDSIAFLTFIRFKKYFIHWWFSSYSLHSCDFISLFGFCSFTIILIASRANTCVQFAIQVGSLSLVLFIFPSLKVILFIVIIHKNSLVYFFHEKVVHDDI